MVRVARYAYLALAWAFVAGLVLQVFFIGLGLFAASEYREVHAYVGWSILHLSPLIILVASPLARAGRRRILQAAALAVTVWIVPILAVLRADAPVVAAFHPVTALLAFWVAIVVARAATSLVGSTDTEASPTRGELAVVAVVVVILLFLSFSGSPTEAQHAGAAGWERIARCVLTIVPPGDNYCGMVTDVSVMLGALADPTRQRVIQLLRAGPRRAGELAVASGTSAPTMSRHLRVLLNAGIVGDERPSDDARARVFWLRPEAIGAVRAWLDELQAAGDEQLEAFKKHVERRDTT